MKPFSIAAVQLSLEYTNNFNLLERKTREVVARFPWVQMVVLSELAAGGTSQNVEHSLEEYLPKLKEISNELKIWYVPGSFYDHKDGRITNAAPVISPEGKLITTCTKIYPFLPYEKGVSPGNEACIFDVPGAGRFGMHICYDLWFPESSRALAMNGAEVILHPSLTDTCDRDVEKAMARATAAQQQCYYIDVNAGGNQGCGLSICVGPDGEILHEANIGDEIILVEVDFEKVKRCRQRGLKGLGQPLKSFRDNPSPFLSNTQNQDYLDSLGNLDIPSKNKSI
ncbi:MAG TPA: carbon-nitrogen hydrolase family protein [Gammaproteobacteria bacterium]|jgi:predicted amidohydrolase|nr:carbon-nitrogen hydrolase family protein [Gammaproteobacteria bacterium]HIK72163.1 carbon-nitrogen hydrolase family protein [Gammaproteobacteria bacterium]